MPVVSAGDLTLLRGEEHVNTVRLSFLVPPTLWKARVNDGSIVKGQTSIPFDAGTGSFFSLIEGLQEIWVGTTDGAHDVGELRIKSISSGDGGVTGTVTVSGHSLSVGDDYYLTFKHDYPLKPKLSYIESLTPDTEAWYMDDDVVYSDQHLEPRPVGIAGPHRAAYLDETTLDVTFNVDASNSYPIASGATISSYSLSVASTADTAVVNFNTGTGLGDITFDTPGFYWAKYGVTDSNGKTQYTYRCYIIHHPDVDQNEYPWVDCESVQLEADWESGGWTCGITAQDNVLLSDIPDHALCIVWQDAYYGTTKKNITYLPDQNSAIFIGYVREDSQTQNMQDGFGDVDLRLSTIDGRLRNIFSFSTSLIAKNGTPSDWWEYKNWQTCGTIIHDLFLWRSTLLEVADVIGLTDNGLFRIFQAFDEGSIYDNANNFAYNEGIRSRILCDQGGRVHLSEDQQLMIDSDRSALTTMFELVQTSGIADYGNVFTMTRRQENSAPFVTSNGIYWDGNTWDAENKPDATGEFCSIAPGGKPHWDGANPQDFPKQTVTSQDHLNQITGRFLAKTNNEVPEVTLEFHGSYNTVLDIAYSEQYIMDLQASENIRGITWSNKPIFCRHIQAVYEASIGSWQVSASFEPESLGEDGVYTECPSYPPLGGLVPALPVATEAPGALITGASVNFKSASGELWTQRLTQDVEDLIEDPFWRTRQSSTSPSNAIMFRCGAGYIKRTTDGWVTTDVTVTPSTNPPNDAGDSPAPTNTGGTYHALSGSRVSQGRFAALYRWQNSGGSWRSWIAYTTNDGTSWTWGYLGSGDCPACINPDMDFTANTSPPVTRVFTAGERNIVVADTDKYVWAYRDSDDGRIYAQMFSVSGGSATWGSRYNVTQYVTSPTGPVIKLFPISSTQFGLVHFAYSGFNPPFYDPIILAVTVLTYSGVTISSHTTNGTMQWDETNEHGDDGDTGNTDAGDAWSDGTYVYVITPLNMLDDGGGPCVESGTDIAVLRGALSGNSITWDTTTCSTSDVNDWQTGVNSRAAYDSLTVQLTSTHAITVYVATNGSLYGVASSGLTFGSETLLTGSDAANRSYGTSPNFRLIRLSDTLAICVAYCLNTSTNKTEIHAWAISRSGTTLTSGSLYNVHTPATQYPNPDVGISTLSRLTNSTFMLVAFDLEDNWCNCDAAFLLSVSGTTISETAQCDYWLTYDASSILSPDADSTTEIAGVGGNYAGTSDYGGQVFDISALESDLNNCPEPVGDFRSLGLSLDKSAGTYAWVTGGDGVNLELVRVTLSSMALSRYTLGAATMAQIGANSYHCYPHVPFGQSTIVYVYGRMNNPDGLGNPAHIIRTLDGGGSFELIEGGWGADWCGSYHLTLAGKSFAARSNASISKLYADNSDNNLLLKVSTTFTAPVNPHGMLVYGVFDYVYLCSGAADPDMVLLCKSPYLTFSDLTYNHDNTEGIKSIVRL